MTDWNKVYEDVITVARREYKPGRRNNLAVDLAISARMSGRSMLRPLIDMVFKDRFGHDDLSWRLVNIEPYLDYWEARPEDYMLQSPEEYGAEAAKLLGE